VKSIIVYTKGTKAQNLYPKRIISPPAPNKCCPSRMEVLGKPRTDEHGRRFCYKRCRVCGFALRYFLEMVPSILTPPTQETKVRKPLPRKDSAPSTPALPAHASGRRSQPGRKAVSVRHSRRKPAGRAAHTVLRGQRSGARRRR
jgi:hypothetical protein